MPTLHRALSDYEFIARNTDFGGRQNETEARKVMVDFKFHTLYR